MLLLSQSFSSRESWRARLAGGTIRIKTSTGSFFESLEVDL
jgi:hypothetical protein